MTEKVIPYQIQAEVFFRDRWLCSHCRRPTIFHLALKKETFRPRRICWFLSCLLGLWMEP